MKRSVPRSILLSEVAIAVLVIYLGIVIWADSRLWLAGERHYLHSGTLLVHLSWSMAALIGIPLRCRTAWQLACVASLLTGVLGILVAGALFALSCLGNAFFLATATWRICNAASFLVLFVLLRWPSSVAFFGDEKLP